MIKPISDFGFWNLEFIKPMNYPAASSGVSTDSLLRHSGLDPESSILFWTPAFAGVTVDAASRGELTRRALKNKVIPHVCHCEHLNPAKAGIVYESNQIPLRHREEAGTRLRVHRRGDPIVKTEIATPQKSGLAKTIEVLK